jgi:ribosomal protein S18 acetylase RimI-like enzyme
MVTIRHAVQQDILAITLLMTDLGYPTTESEMQTRFDNFKAHDDYRSLLAVTDDNEVAGFIGLIKSFYFEHNGSYIRVGALVVSKKHQRMGVGKMLMDEAERWGVGTGADAILLNSGKRDERMAAYAFYQQIGYEIKSSGFIKYLNK